MSLAAATASGDSEADSLAEMADLLQQQLVYNGEVLEIALESLRAYREGTQALAYLDAAVHLSWALLRMLEKWTKGESGKYNPPTPLCVMHV
jgi:replication fork protection complex subunit Tof1/Swi1